MDWEVVFRAGELLKREWKKQAKGTMGSERDSVSPGEENQDKPLKETG